MFTTTRITPDTFSRLSKFSSFRPLVALCALSFCRSFSPSSLILGNKGRRLSNISSRRRTMTTTSSSTTTTTTTTTLPSVSPKIKVTLDPCVVLMKEMIGQYTDKWKDKGGIFSLAQGVVYWRPPPSVNQAVRAALDDEAAMLHMYGPDEGLLELRQAIAQKIADENGLHNHHVMVTVGANQAYMNCILTLLNGGDKAVVFAPYYFNHVMAIQMTLPESGLLVGPSSDDGLPDLEWLEEQFQQDNDEHPIKAVTLVNPGNPTGTLLDRAFVTKVVELCKKYKAWLILDCTYEYFVPADRPFDGCFDAPHVLQIFSFSKAYALAGYRCGYVVISKQGDGDDLYNQMMKVQDTIPICPSRISQIAALGAMQVGKDWVRERIDSLDTGRKAILDALSTLSKVMGGEGAMYVMGKLPAGTDDQEFTRTLVRDFGVACIPGSFCGFPGWIRVCYSNLPPEKCKEAAARLKAGLQSLKSE